MDRDGGPRREVHPGGRYAESESEGSVFLARRRDVPTRRSGL
jgi:hypothetical protein